MRYLKLTTIHFIVPILLGTLIYLLFRPLHLNVFHWLNAVGLYDSILSLRYLTSNLILPDWVVFSLPNGLWSYSFMFFILLIWGDTNNILKWFFVMVVVIISVGSEFGQLWGFVSGTFCLEDIFVYTVGIILGYLSSIKYKEVYLND